MHFVIDFSIVGNDFFKTKERKPLTMSCSSKPSVEEVFAFLRKEAGFTPETGCLFKPDNYDAPGKRLDLKNLKLSDLQVGSDYKAFVKTTRDYFDFEKQNF